MPGLKKQAVALSICSLIIVLFSQCKARNMESNLASDAANYSETKYTGIVQELQKNLRLPGNVHVALAENSSVLAVVGSELSAEGASQQRFAVGGSKSIHLFNPKTLLPLKGKERLSYAMSRDSNTENVRSITGIKDLAISADGRSLAVCAAEGVLLWHDIRSGIAPQRIEDGVLKCQAVDFAHNPSTNKDGIKFQGSNFLAIGSVTGVYFVLVTEKERGQKYDAMQLCNSGTVPVKSVQYVGTARMKDGTIARNANQLFVAIGENQVSGQFGLLEREKHNREYGQRAGVIQPIYTQTQGFRLERGAHRPEVNDRKQCADQLKPLGPDMARPWKTAYNPPYFMLASERERHVHLFSKVAPGTLQHAGTNRKNLQVNTEAEGIFSLAISPEYNGFGRGRFYFTGQSDRTARLWRYNTDGREDLDLVSQIDFDNQGIASSAVFLKDRPLAVFGANGRVYVWDFLKMMRPQNLNALRQPGKITAIGMHSDLKMAYLGKEDGSVTMGRYNQLEKPIATTKVFQNTPVDSIQTSRDIKMSVVMMTSGNKAKLYIDTSAGLAEPDFQLEVPAELGQVKSWKFGTQYNYIFAATKQGSVAMFGVQICPEPTQDCDPLPEHCPFDGQVCKPNAVVKLEGVQGAQVVDIAPYPTRINLPVLVQGNQRAEIHPLAEPVLERRTQNDPVVSPFAIHGVDEERIKALKAQEAAKKSGEQPTTPPKQQGPAIEPQPSAEKPDLVAGSDQTPKQIQEQRKDDAEACQNGACDFVDLRAKVDEVVASAGGAPSEQVQDQKLDLRHRKAAVLLANGQVLMVDFDQEAQRKQYTLEYRPTPVFPFSSYFSKIMLYKQVAAQQPQGAFLTNGQTSYLARSINFDDDGKGLFFLTGSGQAIRYLPVGRIKAANLREIVRFPSKPQKPYFDPWVTFNTMDRKMAQPTFTGFGTQLTAPDSKGGLTTFDLNYYRMSPYSFRKYGLPFFTAGMRASPIVHYATTKYSNFAVAVHQDGSVKLHFIDQAFDISQALVTSEAFNDLFK